MTKWYDKGIKYLLYSLVVVVPIVFTPLFHTAFSAPKLLSLRIITLLIFALIGFKFFVEEKISYRRSRFNLLLLCYGFVSILTTIFSIAIYSSLIGAAGRFLGIMTVLNLLILPAFIWNFLEDKEELKKLLKISVITSSFLAIYGILQYFGIWQEGFNWNQDPQERVFGTIGHGNHFGAYLGMNAVLGVFIFPAFKKNRYKIAIACGLILQFITLFLTASRGAMLGTVIGLLICIINIVITRARQGKLNITKWIIPSLITIVIIFSGIFIFQDNFKQIPLIERSIATVSGIQQGQIPDRLSWWYSSLEMIKDRPLLGFGLSTFRDVYNQYRRLDYVTLEEGDMETQITPEAAHNEYLNIGATQGLLGLFSFLAIIIFVLWKLDMATYDKKKHDEFYTLIGVKGALVVFLVQIIISFGVVATLVPFYILLGVAVGLVEPNSRDKTFKFKGVPKYITTVILIIVISAGTFCSFRGASADINYKQGLIAASEGNLETAIAHFETMVSNRQRQYAYHQAFADFAINTSYPISALKTKEYFLNIAVTQYKEAIRLNPHHPSTHYNLGVALFQLYALTGTEKFYTDGVEYLEASIQKSPNNPLYPYQVGKAYLTLDRPDSKENAKEAFNRALQIRSPYRDIENHLKDLL
jgi:putative inorganic carbon (hco3(-)) transporter